MTPDAGAALDLLQGRLEPLGFACHRLRFEGGGSYPVDNLYAKLGQGGRHLAFAGHTDVVPPGDRERWARSTRSPARSSTGGSTAAAPPT